MLQLNRYMIWEGLGIVKWTETAIMNTWITNVRTHVQCEVPV